MSYKYNVSIIYIILIALILIFGLAFFSEAAPQNEGNIMRNITPETDATYYNGTTTKKWLGIWSVNATSTNRSAASAFCYLDNTCVSSWLGVINDWYINLSGQLTPTSTPMPVLLNATTTQTFNNGHNDSLTIHSEALGVLGNYPMLSGVGLIGRIIGVDSNLFIKDTQAVGPMSLYYITSDSSEVEYLTFTPATNNFTLSNSLTVIDDGGNFTCNLSSDTNTQGLYCIDSSNSYAATLVDTANSRVAHFTDGSNEVSIIDGTYAVNNTSLPSQFGNGTNIGDIPNGSYLTVDTVAVAALGESVANINWTDPAGYNVGATENALFVYDTGGSVAAGIYLGTDSSFTDNGNITYTSSLLNMSTSTRIAMDTDASAARNLYLKHNGATVLGPGLNDDSADITFQATRCSTAGCILGSSMNTGRISGIMADRSSSAYKGELQFLTANNAAETEAMRINYLGDVGIATTTPSAKLHIANTSARSALLVEDSASPDATPFVIDYQGSVRIGHNLAGNERLSIVGGTNNQLVLGSSVADNTSKFAYLNVLNYNIDNTTKLLAFFGGSDGTDNSIRYGGGSGSAYAATYQAFYTSGVPAGTLRATTTLTGVEQMRINAYGSIGLKDTTPDAHLEITGVSETGKDYFNITNSADGDIFNVKNSGRVGIGVAAPISQLDVVGGLGVVINNVTTDNTTKIGYLSTRQYDSDEETWLVFGGASTASQNVASFGGGNAAYNAATDISFWTAGNVSTLTGTERMRITKNGYVGIATTTPGGTFGEILTIVGNSYTTGRATSTVSHATEFCLNNYCVPNWASTTPALGLTDTFIPYYSTAAGTFKDSILNYRTAIPNAVYVGNGAAATDYAIVFDGESDDGNIVWYEDEQVMSTNRDLAVTIGNKISAYGSTLPSNSLDLWYEDNYGNVSLNGGYGTKYTGNAYFANSVNIGPIDWSYATNSPNLNVAGNTHVYGNATTTGSHNFGTADEYIRAELEPYRVNPALGNVAWLKGRSLSAAGGFNLFGMDSGLFIRDTDDALLTNPSIVFLDTGDVSQQQITADMDNDRMAFSNANLYQMDSSFRVSGENSGFSDGQGIEMRYDNTSDYGIISVLDHSAGDAFQDLYLGENTGGTPQLFLRASNRAIGVNTTTPGGTYGELLTVNGDGYFAGDVEMLDGQSYRYNGQPLANASTTLNNYFFGNAGNLTMTGNSNVAFGNQALSQNTTGILNSAFGYQALFNNLGGSYNMAFGANALLNNTGGISNVAIGVNALNDNISGNYNTAIGFDSLHINTTGGSNSAFGFDALYNSNGEHNTAFGINALTQNGQGNYNTAFGSSALYYATNTLGNIAFGYFTGTDLAGTEFSEYNTKSDNYSILLGYNARRDGGVVASTTVLTNAVAIGKNAMIGKSNAMALGGTGADAMAVGIATSTPGGMYGEKLTVVGSSYFQGISGATNPLFTVASSTGMYYFEIGSNGHMFTGGTNPTASSCGTNPTVIGDDNTFRVIIGTGSVTSCLVTFSYPWKKKNGTQISPACMANETIAGTVHGISASSTPTTLLLTHAATSFAGESISVQCRGSENFTY